VEAVAAARRALLGNLVVELDGSSGAIVAAKPRPEVAAEVGHYLTGWPGLDGHGVRVRIA
jgi:hypothetical protein